MTRAREGEEGRARRIARGQARRRGGAAGDDEWTLRDVGPGVSFVVLGGLLIGFVVIAWRNGLAGRLGLVLGVGTLLVGPVLILLGVNAIVRALWSARPRDARERVRREIGRESPSFADRVESRESSDRRSVD